MFIYSTQSFAKQPIGGFKKMKHKDNSYKQAVGKSQILLQAERLLDFKYTHVDPFCCCNEEILSLFLTLTTTQALRIVPATDLFIYSLQLKTEEIEQKIYQVENLRYANAIYSFSDKKRRELYNIPLDTSGECKPLNFNNPEDREWYQDNIIDRFEASGGYHTEGLRSSAYGRYQFMPDTAANYCGRVSSYDCCGDEWKTGTNAESCQDEMYTLFTADNARLIGNYGLEVNSCTVYIAHQQGAGGLAWLAGGNLPTSFETMRNRVELNVGREAWANAESNGVDLDTEEGLRSVYSDYWGNKLGVSNLRESLGGNGSRANSTGMKDFLEQAEGFNNLDRKKHYRKGILYDLYRETEEIKSLYYKGAFHAD